MSLFKKVFSKKKKETLDKGLETSKQSFLGKISKAVAGKSKVDEAVLDEVEEILIASDVGLDTTIKIINRLEERVARDKYINTSELNRLLKDEIAKLLTESGVKDNTKGTFENPLGVKTYVVLVVGVNGVGKTTTIGKLAAQYKAAGKKVLLAAGDTFRAAAVEQLQLWGERVGVEVTARGMNVHPATVAYEAVERGVNENFDVVLIDTAGRLHNKVNLMNELSKIKKVIQKFVPDAPHDVMLVLDGSTGQNAFAQAREFTKATEVTSLAITKLDGTAKGGVVIGISDQFSIPVRYIGVGEQVEDLQVFDRHEFVDSFFGGV
ncbi:MAG: signal recognition particle-docking protein FtsY [Bacteroidota bacterium]